jgi:hypothetical protein
MMDGIDHLEDVLAVAVQLSHSAARCSCKRSREYLQTTVWPGCSGCSLGCHVGRREICVDVWRRGDKMCAVR